MGKDLYSQPFEKFSLWGNSPYIAGLLGKTYIATSGYFNVHEGMQWNHKKKLFAGLF